ILDFKKNYVPKLVNKINGLEINDNLKTFNNKQLLDMYNINFNSIENFENGLYWPDNRIKNKCDIPSTFMIIEGDGMVLPCNAVEYNRDKIIGNINEMNIKQLWNSDKWNEFRKNKLDFCRECPMNMSYVLVFNDDEIERECRVDNFTTQKIEKMIMIDDKKEYITERTEEYLSFFKRDKEFIKKINERYAIESLEYKLNFLYPIFFKNMENDKQIFNSYKNASEFYALRQLLGRPEKFESQLHIFDFMKENLKQGARVMDYGCCVGDFSLLFAKMGYSVVILDLDILTFDFALERFKNRSIKVENYRIGENMKVELLRKKVDFVFCRDVLEHTRHPLYILDYFYESLNNDGYLYTSTMNPGDEIYIGAEHLEETILIAKTEKYKKFFEKRFESLGIKGLYKKRERKKDE
ncbi:MAG: SPASM domain-containing protein, partial [Anaeroplasmataceae bacterium]|nr:SPASM domain-containing protein [Anaeroplasmataceae bacterium]